MGTWDRILFPACHILQSTKWSISRIISRMFAQFPNLRIRTAYQQCGPGQTQRWFFCYHWSQLGNSHFFVLQINPNEMFVNVQKITKDSTTGTCDTICWLGSILFDPNLLAFPNCIMARSIPSGPNKSNRTLPGSSISIGLAAKWPSLKGISGVWNAEWKLKICMTSTHVSHVSLYSC